MQGKISLFVFLLAFVVVITNLLLEKADKDGNIYIKTPRQIWNEVKAGYQNLKSYLKK